MLFPIQSDRWYLQHSKLRLYPVKNNIMLREDGVSHCLALPPKITTVHKDTKCEMSVGASISFLNECVSIWVNSKYQYFSLITNLMVFCVIIDCLVCTNTCYVYDTVKHGSSEGC